MVWLDAYRITNENSVMELVKMLAKILAMGAMDLKQWAGKNISTLLTTYPLR
jgi:hypothetical protein